MQFFFFFYVQPRRYASGHVLFYDCVRNERDAREKIENERVDGLRSDIENAKLAGGYKSLAGRLFDSFRSVLFRGHPERVRCLISLSDFERRCRALLHHLSPCNDRLRVRIPWWSTCVGGCAAPCYAHTHALTHACLSHSTTACVFCPSHARYVCVPLPYSRITILIAVKVLTNDLSECHWSTAGETFLPRRITVHIRVCVLHCNRQVNVISNCERGALLRARNPMKRFPWSNFFLNSVFNSLY